MRAIFVFLFCLCVDLLSAQNNFSTEDYKDIQWEKPHAKPVIRPPFPSPVIADPSFLAPDQTPDGLWHLFAHSIFGIRHYTSTDGSRWRHVHGLTAKKAIRPFIMREQGLYYLFYEKTDKYSPYASHIEMKKSTDLKIWSEAVTILRADNIWSHEGAPGGSVSNPCLVKTDEGYRLYVSAGLVYLRDCGFSEPRYIGYSSSTTIEGPYTWADSPVIQPDSLDPYRNAGAGAIKVTRTKNGYIGYENGIAVLKNELSYSAISLLGSADGIHWMKAADKPFLEPGSGWQRDYVYALDIRYYQGKFYLFYNARRGHHWTVGRECLGVITGTLK